MEDYTTTGNFLLLKQRSRDALGTLWRAGELERTGFKRIVWLRRFDQAGLDRAALEAQASLVQQLGESLKAINVVRNATLSSADGVPCLAYDYVPGPPLGELFSRLTREQYPIAIDNALLIVEKLAAALCAALALEVGGEPLAHGFLVPQLVILGNDGEAMVAGFGLTKGLLANLDRAGVREMAAPYLAPEVLATHASSRRADVYSLGAILYQLLCGHPLPADTPQRTEALAAPQLAYEEGPVPEDLVAVLRKSLAARPEDRYSSAVDFKRDLERLLYGGAYSPTTFNLALFMDRLYRQEIEQEDRDLQREKTIDVTPYVKPPKAPIEAPVVAAPRSRTGLFVALGAVVVLAAAIIYLLFARPSPPPAQNMAPQNMADLVQSEVARQLAEKEQQLRDELDREKQETEKLRSELADQQKRGNAVATGDARREQGNELQRQIAAREEEQRKREEELAKLQRQRAQAATPTVAAPVSAVAQPVPAEVPLLTGGPKVGPTPLPERAAIGAPVPTSAPVVTSATVPASESVSQPEATPPEEGPVDASRVDAPPKLVVESSPTYPALARRTRVEGVVTLSCVIDKEGNVKSVKVMHGLPMGLTEAAVNAVKQWRYAPSTLNGKPVEVAITVNVTFRLQ